MKFKFNKNALCVGLDIQANEIRAVAISKTAKRFVLKKAIRHFPSTPLLHEKGIHNSALVEALETLTQILGENTAVAYCLPGCWVNMQTMTLANNLSNEEIIACIKQEVARNLPGNNDRLCVDYKILAKKPTINEIYYAVAKEDLIAQVVDAIHAAKLQVKILDIDAYAMLRMGKRSLFYPGNNINALLKCADGIASLILFNKERIHYLHEWGYQDIKELKFLLEPNVQKSMSAVFIKQITAMIICAPANEATALRSCKLSAITNLVNFDFFSVMQVAKEINQQQLAEDLVYLLPASGAALRSIPKW